ncbi:MAG TPA: SPFH domain-containing protein [Bacteroidia bacterium]|jgi:regulator of protease activity HflC (stomatin/prohibitin superfamily)|nr:SPFH domain-containing protein [Bacteroidia bacterium]
MKQINHPRQVLPEEPKFIFFMLFAALMIGAAGCTTIMPGESGIKVVRGRLQPGNFSEGRHAVGFGVHYIHFSTRIRELSVQMTLPTREGVEAKTDLTLLYHIKPESIHDIYLTLGMNYEKSIIMNNFSAIARETCLNYKAIDLITQRDSLERAIYVDMNKDLGHYGFVIDQVLVRDVDVPDDIDRVIEKKVLSEQQAKQQEVDILKQKKETEANIERQRKEMEFGFEKKKREIESSIEQQRLEQDFAVEKQKKEAERSLIEAEATRKAQTLTNSAITELMIKYKQIEVMKAIANSPNSKLIITDGKTPLTLKAGE